MARAAPPAQCQTGQSPTSNNNYVVCRADASSAWVSSTTVGGAQYRALQICQFLGYSSVSAQGGTCGNVCGYCQSATSCTSRGNETYDGGGGGGVNSGNLIGSTVHWRCSGPIATAGAPSVTSVSPASGPDTGGTAVTINGANLSGASAVRFGSVAATNFSINTSASGVTTIQATTPARAAGVVDAAVTTSDGTSTPNSLFTYIASIVEVPMSEWMLALLVLSLAGVGVLILRRRATL